jgi:hypothetical protein
VLSVLLRFRDYDYPFGIFKLFLKSGSCVVDCKRNKWEIVDRVTTGHKPVFLESVWLSQCNYKVLFVTCLFIVVLMEIRKHKYRYIKNRNVKEYTPKILMNVSTIGNKKRCHHILCIL